MLRRHAVLASHQAWPVERAMRIIIGVLLALVALTAIGWLGLRISPRPFDPYPGRTSTLRTTPLRDGLPDPVKRFYRALYADEIPIIESAVISGRARLRLFGITFPGRFRFTHIAGQDYRHYIETTILGLPIMKINEYYLDGHSRLELPFGVVENEPKVDQAANLGLWAESVWLPAIFVTDPRVRWEAIDDHTARLVVPLGETDQSFVVRFDPRTHMISFLEAMRFRDAADEAKILWINAVREWRDINGHSVPAVGAAIWFDQGTPWAVFAVEDLVYNADVSEYIRIPGP
jgi:hypothetical protein